MSETINKKTNNAGDKLMSQVTDVLNNEHIPYDKELINHDECDECELIKISQKCKSIAHSLFELQLLIENETLKSDEYDRKTLDKLFELEEDSLGSKITLRLYADYFENGDDDYDEDAEDEY